MKKIIILLLLGLQVTQLHAQRTTVFLSNELEITDKNLIELIKSQLLSQKHNDGEILCIEFEDVISKDEFNFTAIFSDFSNVTSGLVKAFYLGHAYLDGELIIFDGYFRERDKFLEEIDIVRKKKNPKRAKIKAYKSMADYWEPLRVRRRPYWTFKYKSGKYEYVKELSYTP